MTSVLFPHPLDNREGWGTFARLLQKIMGLHRKYILKEFKGALAENFVLGSLLAQGFKTPHY